MGCEVDGVKYIQAPERENNSCDGCVGQVSDETEWNYEKCESLCIELRTPNYCQGLGIWVEA